MGKKTGNVQYNLFSDTTERQIKDLSKLSEETQKVIGQIVELFKIKPSSKLLPGLRELSQEDVDRLSHMQNLGLEINAKNIFSLLSTPLNDNEVKTLSEYQKRGIEATRDLIYQLISGKTILKKNINEVKMGERFFSGLGDDPLDVWLKANREDLLKCYSLREIKDGYEYAKANNYVFDEVFGKARFKDAIEKGKCFGMNAKFVNKHKCDVEFSNIKNIPQSLLKFLDKNIKSLDPKWLIQINGKFGRSYGGINMHEQCDALVKILKKCAINDKYEVTIDSVEEWLDLIFDYNVSMVSVYQLIELGAIREISSIEIYRRFGRDSKLINLLTPEIANFLKKYVTKDKDVVTIDFVLDCVDKILNKSGRSLDEFKHAINILEKYHKKDDEKITLDFVLNWMDFVYKKKDRDLDVIEQLAKLGIIKGVGFKELGDISSVIPYWNHKTALSNDTMDLISKYGITFSDTHDYECIWNRRISLDNIKSLKLYFGDWDKQGLDGNFVKKLLTCEGLKPYMLEKKNIGFIKKYYMGSSFKDDPKDAVWSYIDRCKKMKELEIDIEDYRKCMEDKLKILDKYFNPICLWRGYSYGSPYSEYWKYDKAKIENLENFVLTEKCINFAREILGKNMDFWSYLKFVEENHRYLWEENIENVLKTTEKLMELKEIGILDIIGFKGCKNTRKDMLLWVWKYYSSSPYNSSLGKQPSSISNYLLDLDAVKLKKGIHYFKELETDDFKWKNFNFISWKDLAIFQYMLDNSFDKIGWMSNYGGDYGNSLPYCWEKLDAKSLLERWKSIISSGFLGKLENIERYKYKDLEKSSLFADKIMELDKLGILDFLGIFKGYDKSKINDWVWEHRGSISGLLKLDVNELKKEMHYFEELETDDFKRKNSGFLSLNCLIEFWGKYYEESKRKLLKMWKYAIESNTLYSAKNIEGDSLDVEYISPFYGEDAEALSKLKVKIQGLKSAGEGDEEGEKSDNYLDYLHDKEKNIAGILSKNFYWSLFHHRKDTERIESEKSDKFSKSVKSLTDGRYVHSLSELSESEKTKLIKIIDSFIYSHFSKSIDVGDLLFDLRLFEYTKYLDEDPEFMEWFLEKILSRYQDLNDASINRLHDYFYKHEMNDSLRDILLKSGGVDLVVDVLNKKGRFYGDYIDYELLMKYDLKTYDKVRLIKHLAFKSDKEIDALFSDIQKEYGEEMLLPYQKCQEYKHRRVDGDCNLESLYSESFLKRFGYSDGNISEVYKRGSGKFKGGDVEDIMKKPIEEFVFYGKVDDMLNFSFNLSLKNNSDKNGLGFAIGGGYLKVDPVNKEVLLFGMNNDGCIPPKFYPIINDILGNKFDGYKIKFGSPYSQPDAYDMELLNKKK